MKTTQRAALRLLVLPVITGLLGFLPSGARGQDADPQGAADGEDEEEVVEAYLDPVFIEAGLDDHELSFNLVRFDLDSPDALGKRRETFELTLESKPDYVSNFKVDKTKLVFDPKDTEVEVVASFDISGDASPDGVDEIVLFLKASNPETVPQGGRLTIPLQMERNDLMLLTRTRVDAIRIESVYESVDAVLPAGLPTIAELQAEQESGEVRHTVAQVVLGIFRIIADSPETLDQLRRESPNQPFVIVDNVAGKLLDGGIESFYTTVLPEPGSPIPRVIVMVPPELEPEPKVAPPSGAPETPRDPAVVAREQAAEEEKRKVRFEARSKVFAEVTQLVDRDIAELDGWIVAYQRMINLALGVDPPADDEEDPNAAAVITALSGGLLGALEEFEKELADAVNVERGTAEPEEAGRRRGRGKRGLGGALMEGMRASPPADFIVVFSPPEEMRAMARVQFEAMLATITPEERHMEGQIRELGKTIDGKWVSTSLRFGPEPLFRITLRLADEQTPASLAANLNNILSRAAEEAAKANRSENAAIQRVRDQNFAIHGKILAQFQFKAEGASLVLEQDTASIKKMLELSLQLREEPVDNSPNSIDPTANFGDEPAD